MEIMVTCSSKNGGSIGSGIYIESEEELEEIKRNDPGRLLMGLSESYYENYRDFEDVVALAAKESIQKISDIEEVSEEEIKMIIHTMLQKELGDISVRCEIDGEENPVEACGFGIDSSIVEDALLCILEPEVVDEMAALQD